MTVRGPIAASDAGFMLPHEHLMLIFGADPADPPGYDAGALMNTVAPYVGWVKKLGCRTVVDATAVQFGRAPELLRRVSERTGVNVLTNTGYYSAGNKRYVPKSAFGETADRIAKRWVAEWEKGIGETGIRPGFIQLGVDDGPLSEIDQKLVEAAALTHRVTGLTIAVHTGDNPAAAREQVAILRRHGVAPEAWIWVNAHSIKNDAAIEWAAKEGAWLSFDGLDERNVDRHLNRLQLMKRIGRLDRAMLSHEGNSYRPVGRPPRGYDTLFTTLVPRLRRAGFTAAEIEGFTHINPQRAFTVRERRA